jgi:alkylation response protein AidB-like acyl-CoA dehydrogenase
MPAFQEYFDPSHQLVRDSVRRFVEREILPDIDQWEEAESFPASFTSRPVRRAFSASVTPRAWVAATKVICSPRSPPAKS